MCSPSGEPENLDTLLAELPSVAAGERLAAVGAHGDPDLVVAGLTQIAERLVMGNLQQALGATVMLVEVADQVGSPGGRSSARRARAQALTYANRFDDALAALEESVELAQRAADERAAAQARLTMVHALARLGRYGEA